MLRLTLYNLIRRPVRTALTLAALSLGVAVLGCLWAFGEDYRQGLSTELNRMGMQLMLVPLGCPYDAAARVIKGRTLENSLPEAALQQARLDPAVAVAAPLLMAAVPRPDQGRTDLWVGLDQAALQLKPWWKVKAGQSWFPDDYSVILGAEAAAVEMRAPGDRLYSPETRTTLTVVGVLQRSGTSDDSVFFVPLKTCQAMFHQPQRITAVAIRLHDPTTIREAAARLQQIRGAQVVTLTEMMGTFLNLVGSVQTLIFAIALIGVVASALTVFNTLLGSVVEQSRELATMRALGASRPQIFSLVMLEALILTGAGSACGLLLASFGDRIFGHVLEQYVPLAPDGLLLSMKLDAALLCTAAGIGVGLLSCLYPAWLASRVNPAAAVKSQ